MYSCDSFEAAGAIVMVGDATFKEKVAVCMSLSFKKTETSFKMFVPYYQNYWGYLLTID